MKKFADYVAFVRDDMGLKGGPLTVAFASHFWGLAKRQNAGASQDELSDMAKKLYRQAKDSGDAPRIYERVKEESARKSAAKRAQKLASKNIVLSETSPNLP